MASQFYQLFAVICFYFSNCKRDRPEPGGRGRGKRGAYPRANFSLNVLFFQCAVFKRTPFSFLFKDKSFVFRGKFATNFLHEDPKAGSK